MNVYKCHAALMLMTDNNTYTNILINLSYLHNNQDTPIGTIALIFFICYLIVIYISKGLIFLVE